MVLDHYKIETFDEIRKYREIVPNPILSEYLLPDDEEYTAGTYRTTQNIVYVIIIKRKLKFGMTNSGHVVTDSVLRILQEYNFKDKASRANNIQFRLTSEGPKVLEINPRFSGTTGIRANYGFNEIEMWINESIECTLEQPILKRALLCVTWKNNTNLWISKLMTIAKNIPYTYYQKELIFMSTQLSLLEPYWVITPIWK